MAVKIRLARRGRKKLALYDIVAADARAPRDGRFIEKLGNYNPNTHPATILLKEEKALQWLLKGAQPTNTARTILSSQGILLKKHLQLGVNKGAITQEEADKKLEAWKQEREKQQAQKSAKASKASSASKPQATAKKQEVATEDKKEAPAAIKKEKEAPKKAQEAKTPPAEAAPQATTKVPEDTSEAEAPAASVPEESSKD